MGLQELVDEVTNDVGRGGAEQEVTERVASTLRTHLRTGVALNGLGVVPHKDRYVMYPLYVAPDASFCIAGAVWGPGQSTPIHDHGTWGVVGIHSGVENEERFNRPDGDGSPPRHLATSRWEPGSVTVCCTTDQDVHRVACGSDTPCIGLHVYGSDIGTTVRHWYDAHTGERRTFISTWEPLHGPAAPIG